jgi:hypothetical protein
MRSWPQDLRLDRGLMERICEHEYYHPDPDDPNAVDPDIRDHDCDGCCAPAFTDPIKYPPLPHQNPIGAALSRFTVENIDVALDVLDSVIVLLEDIQKGIIQNERFQTRR